MTSTDSLLGSFTVPFEHGLLVLENSTTSSRHDDWDAATERIHLDGDSLYVGVQGSVDGLVCVEIYEAAGIPVEVAEGMSVCFSGDLGISSRILKVSDSDNVVIFSVRTIDEHSHVKVLVDDEEWPARVVVIIGT